MRYNDSKLWRMNNPEKQLIGSAKSRAKTSGIKFDISHKDVVIPYACPLLDVPLEYIVGEGWRDTAPSLDRIDNSIGYVKGNIQVISKKANTMKSSASIGELLRFARNVIDLYE